LNIKNRSEFISRNAQRLENKKKLLEPYAEKMQTHSNQQVRFKANDKLYHSQSKLPQILKKLLCTELVAVMIPAKQLVIDQLNSESINWTKFGRMKSM